MPDPPSDNDVFWSLVDKKGEDECWEWKGGTHKHGYGNFKRGDHNRAHVYSYATFVGPIKKGLHVLHKCNNAKCVNPKHLYAGTSQQNMMDMAESGIQKGENNPGSAITEKIARSIIKSLPSGKKLKSIDSDHQTTIGVVRGIAYNGNWSHVEGYTESIEKFKNLSSDRNSKRKA